MLNILDRLYQKAWTAHQLRKLGIRSGHRFDPVVADFLLKFQPAFQGRDLVVYDIGASVGRYAEIMARLPRVSAVHAFEPVPASFARLAALAAPEPKIQPWQVAVGDTNGTVPLRLNDEPDCSSLLGMLDRHRTEFTFSGREKELPVRVVRLDDFVVENQIPLPHVLKIDVQGYEAQALSGAARCLTHARAVITEVSFVPLYAGSALFDDIHRQMKQSGFHLAGMFAHHIAPSGNYLQADALFQKQI